MKAEFKWLKAVDGRHEANPGGSHLAYYELPSGLWEVYLYSRSDTRPMRVSRRSRSPEKARAEAEAMFYDYLCDFRDGAAQLLAKYFGEVEQSRDSDGFVEIWGVDDGE